MEKTFGRPEERQRIGRNFRSGQRACCFLTILFGSFCWMVLFWFYCPPHLQKQKEKIKKTANKWLSLELEDNWKITACHPLPHAECRSSLQVPDTPLTPTPRLKGHEGTEAKILFQLGPFWRSLSDAVLKWVYKTGLAPRLSLIKDSKDIRLVKNVQHHSLCKGSGSWEIRVGFCLSLGVNPLEMGPLLPEQNRVALTLEIA